MMQEPLLEPIHPGEILAEEFMAPLGLTQNRLGRDIDVPVNRINQIINGKRAISADTALRLALYFGTTPQLWMGLQMEYDLRLARRAAAENLSERIRPLNRTAS